MGRTSKNMAEFELSRMALDKSTESRRHPPTFVISLPIAAVLRHAGTGRVQLADEVHEEQEHCRARSWQWPSRPLGATCTTKRSRTRG